MATTSTIDLTKSSASSQKLEVFYASTPKEKEKISGYRIIDTSISHMMFSNCFYVPDARCQQFHLVTKSTRNKDGCHY